MFSMIRGKKKGSIYMGSSWKGWDDDDEGLRLILKKLVNGNSNNYNNNNNIVIKPIFLQEQPLKSGNGGLSFCFLKSCHLCGKILSLDREIYMYRGDLGFCSVECRDRQIYIDETKEIEVSTKKLLSTFRHGGGRCETSRHLEDFRMRRHPFPGKKSPVIFL